jgi:hypothetical protein
MKSRKLVYEGKSKILYEGPEPGSLVQYFKDDATDQDGKKKADALDAYCINLNRKAAEGKVDPLIGRDKEIQRTIQVLCRRQKNNPLFVGELMLSVFFMPTPSQGPVLRKVPGVFLYSDKACLEQGLCPAQKVP